MGGYLAATLAPLIPRKLYGRSATKAPGCHGPEAVWHAWESMLCPMADDPAWPEDTLFIIADEDFRFRAADEAVEQAFEEEACESHPGEGVCAARSVSCGAAGFAVRVRASAPSRVAAQFPDAGRCVAVAACSVRAFPPGCAVPLLPP